MKILIVDDKKSKLNRIQKVVSEFSGELQIETASNNISAIKALQKSDIVDLMIIDLNLPVRDGDNPVENGGVLLLKEIVRNNQIPHKPRSIIGLTAYESIKSTFEKEFNNEGWFIVIYNPKSSEWEQMLKNKLNYLVDGGQSQKRPKILLITLIVSIINFILSVLILGVGIIRSEEKYFWMGALIVSLFSEILIKRTKGVISFVVNMTLVILFCLFILVNWSDIYLSICSFIIHFGSFWN